MRFRSHASPLAATLVLLAGLVAPLRGAAIGEATAIEVRGAYFGSMGDPRPLARTRIAWALRTRTSVEARLATTRVRFDDPSIFDSPLLYVAGEGAFPAPTEAEVLGLRRFVELGGFVLFDDARPDDPGFASSVRAVLARAFPAAPLRVVSPRHTIYRSFYLVPRPIGRVEGPETVDGMERDGRLAVVLTHHDVAGAVSRDNLGTYTFDVVGGGDAQREQAMRFAVNLVMYALCLDYKDDQVHAPFLMRRRPGSLPTP